MTPPRTCTDASPWRLDSLERSGLRSRGRWAKAGGVVPIAAYSATCLGVEGSHSWPRITCEMPICKKQWNNGMNEGCLKGAPLPARASWSSTTLARWYVGKPSVFKRICGCGCGVVGGAGPQEKPPYLVVDGRIRKADLAEDFVVHRRRPVRHVQADDARDAS